MKINIVLFQPEIPQNTGNIARTCSATGSTLHLVHPLGFSLDEKHLRRAGLDYWDGLDIHEYKNDLEFFAQFEHSQTHDEGSSIYFLSQKGGHSLWETNFCSPNFSKTDFFVQSSLQVPYKGSYKGLKPYQRLKDIWLVFGRESCGLDEKILLENKDKCIRIPMIDGKRSLNLSNAVAVTVYEVLRQTGGFGLKIHGALQENL